MQLLLSIACCRRSVTKADPTNHSMSLENLMTDEGATFNFDRLDTEPRHFQEICPKCMANQVTKS